MKYSKSKIRYALLAIFFTAVLTMHGESNASLWSKYGGTLKVPLTSSRLFLDPARDMSYEELMLFFATVDCLFVINENGNVLPDIASGFNVDEIGKRYVITIDSKARFHDGTQVTSKEVIRALKSDFEKLGKRSRIFENIEEMNPLGDYKVEFILKETDPLLPRKLAHPFCAITRGNAIVKSSGSTSLTYFMGTGAFKIREVAPQGIIRLVRNDEYHRGKSYLDAIEFHVMPNDEDSFIEFLMGNLDIHNVSYGRYADLKRRPEIKLHEKESYDTLILDFGYCPWRSNLIHNLDPQSILHVTMNNLGSVTSGIYPGDENSAPVLNYTNSGLPKRGLVLGYASDGQFLEPLAKSIATRWMADGVKTKIIDTGGMPHPECDIKLKAVKSLGEEGDFTWLALRCDLGSPDYLPQSTDRFTTPERIEHRTFLSEWRFYPLARLKIVYALSSRINDFELVATCVPDFWSISLK